MSLTLSCAPGAADGYATRPPPCDEWYTHTRRSSYGSAFGEKRTVERYGSDKASLDFGNLKEAEREVRAAS